MLLRNCLVLYRHCFPKVNKHPPNTKQLEGTKQDNVIEKKMKGQLEWHSTKHR
ncbi:hypothetical protein ABG768_019241, partial [Culter alburnus]